MEGDEQATTLRTRSARLKAANTSPNAKNAVAGGDASPLLDGDESEEKMSGTRRISSRRSQTNGLGISTIGEDEKSSNPTEPSKSTDISGLYDLEMESGSLEEEEAREEEKDVSIRAEDKKKLNIVIRAFAPDLLRLRTQQQQQQQLQQQQQVSPSTSNLASQDIDPRKRGAERRAARASDLTLDDLLSQPKLGIRQLRDHLIKLRAPFVTPAALRAHLSGSHILPSRETLDDDRKKLIAISTCLALVEEIARSINSEGTTSSEGGRIGDYALQMRLPGGDYFTNTVSMTAKEASEIDPAYAKIVDFSATRLAPRSQPVPTLGDRLYDALRTDKTQIAHPILGMPRRYRREDEEVIKPVSHLYYGPWSSFAPTYDSFDGQMSHEASNALWRAKRDEAIEMRRVAARKPTLYGTDARERLEDLMDEMDTDLDVDLILDGYDDLPDLNWDQSQTDNIDEILTRNATLLTYLQGLQGQRWHQLMAKTVANKKGYEEALAEPDANEQAIARALLASLTGLLSVQPRLNDSHEKRKREGEIDDHIIPSTEKLQSLSSSAAIDPALTDGRAEQGVWGTLDKTAFGPEATRRQALSRSMASARPVAAVRDNETLRLSKETEEKATNQTMSLGATVLGANRDRGKGLLDRFASVRDYRLEDHPHDRKPPVPPAPAGRPPGPIPPVGARPQMAGPHQNIVQGRPPFQSPRPGMPQFHPHHQARPGYPPVSNSGGVGHMPFGRPSPLASNGTVGRPPAHQAMATTSAGSPAYR